MYSLQAGRRQIGGGSSGVRVAWLREAVDKVIQLEKWGWREGLGDYGCCAMNFLSHLHVQSLLAWQLTCPLPLQGLCTGCSLHLIWESRIPMRPLTPSVLCYNAPFVRPFPASTFHAAGSVWPLPLHTGLIDFFFLIFWTLGSAGHTVGA